MQTSANNISDEDGELQISMFSESSEKLEKDRKLQETMLKVKNKFGKNAILKGMDFNEKAMTKQRNMQIGEHQSQP